MPFDISVSISKYEAAVPTSTSGLSFDQCFQANDCSIPQALAIYTAAEHLYHSFSPKLPSLLSAFIKNLCGNSDN